jgi:molybdenum cofactor cytidylyltransferase
MSESAKEEYGPPPAAGDLTCIVLAAGSSSRMGRPKQLMDAGGIPLFRRVLNTVLTRFPTPLLVQGAADLRAALKADAYRGVHVVDNPRWAEGQLGSMQAGIRAARSLLTGDPSGTLPERVLVVLADLPLLKGKTIDAFLALDDSVQAAYASCRGRRGHPVLFGPEAIRMLMLAHPSERAIKVVHPLEPLAVEVDDPGIYTDVDTPEDYTELFVRNSLE